MILTVCSVCIVLLIADYRLPASDVQAHDVNGSTGQQLPPVARILVGCSWLGLSTKHIMSACVDVWYF